ncbi:hypothetical protein K443DRAFT_100327 [Laccaria amethystina LaAM-08-1]|uniref:Uncharacterized protein n=1 Tax=Laccaria amethystina LaAM-08-1 TaxID=1095629 RepID=A0A0C9XRZ3_9AGAR|nr:hypothetical protein K443DRAFT_100327 [Laccaria amethystina LaAM-08-1]
MSSIAIFALFAAMGTNAYSTADFLTPPDWFAHGLGNSGGVGKGGSMEPINVIISAQSQIDPFTALTSFSSFSTCFNWISTLQAAVNPGQTTRVDQTVGLRDGGCAQFFVGGNHFRAWPQTLPDGNTAYFIAASTETPCISDGGNPAPPFVPNWHCIDADGFNEGRDQLTDDFVGVSIQFPFVLGVQKVKLYPSGVGTDAGKGSAIDHIPYDGQVNILTLTLPDCPTQNVKRSGEC